MKAYKAWDEKAFDPCSTIIFAESIKEAKKRLDPFKIIGSNNLLTDISVLHILKKWNIFFRRYKIFGFL